METRQFRALMLQGTGSDVGKSLIVAGLCRLFANRGLRVRPFKPQNMSNNAAVTSDGGEIGRAQALQARAARTPLSVHMNPVLLKPQSEVGAQVVVQGQVKGNAKAQDYHELKADLMPKVLESFSSVGFGSDLVIVEGAGSPAEINLRAGDIANMGFAGEAHVPVILVGDIERGGVIASIFGTFELLQRQDRDLTKGFIVNKFRGDIGLFDNGVTALEERTGSRCFGVIPFFPLARHLPQEDALALDRQQLLSNKGTIKVIVPRLSRISNFDDLDPLIAETDVSVTIIEAGNALPGDADLIVIPGSKATLADLAQIREEGWDIDILAHHRRGGLIVGLCGGYQILGKVVVDPDGIEGPPGEAPGLGLLDVTTVLTGDKSLIDRVGKENLSGQEVRGYEMHIGKTEGPDTKRPWLTLADGQTEGAISSEGRVFASYLHGMFAADEFRREFLTRLGSVSHIISYEETVDQALDKLASHLEKYLDVDALLASASYDI